VVPRTGIDAEAAGLVRSATGAGRESPLLVHVPKVEMARVDRDGT
jgi:hypothetical protein